LLVLSVQLLPVGMARAQVAPHGPVLAVEAERGSLLWTREYSASVEGDNSAATFDFDRSVRAPAQGGALRLGWKLAPHDVFAYAGAVRVGYAGSFTEPFHYDTGRNDYRFTARSRWLTTRAVGEVQVWDLLSLGAGAGYGFIDRWRSAPRGGRGTHSYVLAGELRVRLPPGSPVVGYVSVGHEMLGLSPITAFWERRWTIGTYSYAGLGVEFDGVGLWGSP
jgi:hypothetical protein